MPRKNILIIGVEGTQGCGKTTLFEAMKKTTSTTLTIGYHEVTVHMKYVCGQSDLWKNYPTNGFVEQRHRQPGYTPSADDSTVNLLDRTAIDCFTKQTAIGSDMMERINAAIESCGKGEDEEDDDDTIYVIVTERSSESCYRLYSRMDFENEHITLLQYGLLGNQYTDGKIRRNLKFRFTDYKIRYETIVIDYPLELCLERVAFRNRDLNKEVPTAFIKSTALLHKKLYLGDDPEEKEGCHRFDRGLYTDKPEEMCLEFALLVKKIASDFAAKNTGMNSPEISFEECTIPKVL